MFLVVRPRPVYPGVHQRFSPAGVDSLPMREHTYSKFSPDLGDAVDLQSLLDGLADFLLQSGFAGGQQYHPYWGETGEDADKSLDALRQAILDALIQSGQFTPEMLEALRDRKSTRLNSSH